MTPTLEQQAEELVGGGPTYLLRSQHERDIREGKVQKALAALQSAYAEGARQALLAAADDIACIPDHFAAMWLRQRAEEGRKCEKCSRGVDECGGLRARSERA